MGRSTSQVALKTIVNTKMTEGTLIRNFMTHITRLFNKMGIPRAKINGETKVNMILETLLDSFKQFKLNYSMDKILMN